MNIGYGKVILLGEHFVVHGCPAIAVGLSNHTQVSIVKAERNEIITDRRVNTELSLAGIQAVLDSLNIRQHYKVRMSGNLPNYGGLGSSAAFCVALIRALSQEHGLSFTDEQVCRHAYNGEKAFHGNPSGIDNTIATYRGAILFRRGAGGTENRIERLKLAEALDIVIAYTGKSGATSAMIEMVAKYKAESPARFAQLMTEASEIVNAGRHAIEGGRLGELGRLMTQNHGLLQEAGVSIKENDDIVELSLGAGALGAKLTGGGCGGHCIALAKNKEDAEKIQKALKEKTYKSFYSRVE